VTLYTLHMFWISSLKYPVIQHGTPLKGVDKASRLQELEKYTLALETGEVDITVLQKLALLSFENPYADLLSPVTSSGSLAHPPSPSPFMGSSRSLPSLYTDMWNSGKNFDRLLRALLKYLDSAQASLNIRHSYALIC
jgi:CLIP-associating protein 1/2